MDVHESRTFCFAGESAVGENFSDALKAQGFVAVELAEADVVFTYCMSQSALEDLYYDGKGVLQLTKEGVVLVNLAPSTVAFAQELCAMGSVSEKHVLDAPVVVRDVVAEKAFSQRNLAIVVGGAEEVFKRVEPMLKSIAAKVMWMGKAGCGQSAKIALTLSSATALVGLVEAYASLDLSRTEAPVDGEDYLEVVSSLGMLTPSQEAFVEAMQDSDFKGTVFTIECLMGELAAALTSLDDGDVILPQAESAFRLMELLAMVGGVTYGPASLKLVYADEETSQKYGLDWSRAEGAFEHDHECTCEDGEDCDCGHHHRQSTSDYMSFSSN